MPDREDEIVIPVVREELHVDAVPVQTGGVRVTKHVETYDQIVEQELKRGRVEVKRVKANRIVDGPQESSRIGNTLVIPVVSEVLRIEKQWVVTEEIHVTQLEDCETIRHSVPVQQEQVEVERFETNTSAKERA